MEAAEGLVGELEEEQGGAGLPGVGQVGGEEQVFAIFGEAAAGGECGEGEAGMNLEVAIEGLQNGIEATSVVEAAIETAGGERPTRPPATLPK